MPRLTDRQKDILFDYKDVMDDPTNNRDGYAYPSELGYNLHGIKDLVSWGYLELLDANHSADSDYRITERGRRILDLHR